MDYSNLKSQWQAAQNLNAKLLPFNWKPYFDIPDAYILEGPTMLQGCWNPQENSSEFIPGFSLYDQNGAPIIEEVGISEFIAKFLENL